MLDQLITRERKGENNKTDQQKQSTDGQETKSDVTFITSTYLVSCNNNALLFHAPGISVDLGIELVVPPLPALLADAAREKGGDEAPLPLAILLNKPALT